MGSEFGGVPAPPNAHPRADLWTVGKAPGSRPPSHLATRSRATAHRSRRRPAALPVYRPWTAVLRRASDLRSAATHERAPRAASPTGATDGTSQSSDAGRLRSFARPAHRGPRRKSPAGRVENVTPTPRAWSASGTPERLSRTSTVIVMADVPTGTSIATEPRRLCDGFVPTSCRPAIWRFPPEGWEAP